MGWCFARLYDFLTSRTEDAGLRDWRRTLLQRARGRTVEVGSGTGANLPFYTDAVDTVFATEPDRHMRRRLAARAEQIAAPPIEVVDAGAERLPYESGSIDTVVTTLVLCTVPDPMASLREVMRVLRPGGELLFLEHVAHLDPGVHKWQRRLEPFWRCFAEGCHLTRRTGEWMREVGFEVADVCAARMPKAPAILPTIRGVARKPGEASKA